MRPETREKIMGEIVQFAQLTLPLDIDIDHLKRAFPFHAVFFTDEGLRAFKNQRKIVTGLGQKLIPRIAQMVAMDRYQIVHLNHRIAGKADKGMIDKLRQIVEDLRAGRRKPDAQKEWEEILASAVGREVREEVIADLYIGDFRGGPLFVEIKSPLPNLDICAQTKQKMLTFRVIMHAQGQTKAQAYIGLWYNPDIYREKYSRNITRRVLDMDHEVLLGEDFWDTIGGPGTYEELLDVLQEAKRKIRGR